MTPSILFSGRSFLGYTLSFESTFVVTLPTIHVMTGSPECFIFRDCIRASSCFIGSLKFRIVGRISTHGTPSSDSDVTSIVA